MFRSLLSCVKWSIAGFFESPIDTLITKRLVDFYVGLERDGVIRHVNPGNSFPGDKPPLDHLSPPDALQGHVPSQRAHTEA